MTPHSARKRKRPTTGCLIHTKAVVNDIIGVKGKDFVDWDCYCCGRCGSDKLEFMAIFRPDLLKLIQKAEKDDEKPIDK